MEVNNQERIKLFPTSHRCGRTQGIPTTRAMDAFAYDNDPVVVERRARRPRASSSSSASRRLAFSAVAFALSTRVVATRAEVVVSSDEVSITTRTESPPLPSLTLGDVVAKHVAFPRETLVNHMTDRDDEGTMCSSLQGPTCETLFDPHAPTERSLEEESLELSPVESKRSKVSLIRLDSIEDLVTYFKKTTVDDLKKLGLDVAGQMGRIQERLTELSHAAAGGRSTSSIVQDMDLTEADFRTHSSAVGGPFDGSVKSEPGFPRRTAIFYNSRPRMVSIYWVDFRGSEVHYVDVHPRHHGVVKTFQRHVWIVREKHDNAFVSQYVVGDEDTSTQRFTIAL